MERNALQNSAMQRGIDCNIEYSEDDSSVIFYIQLLPGNKSSEEYALVIHKGASDYYTAAIVMPKMKLDPIKVDKAKIANATVAELVNIETEEVIFSSAFSHDSSSLAYTQPAPVEYTPPVPVQDLVFEEAPPPVEEAVQQAPLEDISETVQEQAPDIIEATGDEISSDTVEYICDDEKIDAAAFDSLISEPPPAINEEPAQSCFVPPPAPTDSPPENADNTNQFEIELEDDDAFFSAFESEISFIGDEESDEAHIIDFTPYFRDEASESEDIKLINDRPEHLSECLPVFASFESTPRNRVFYALDETIVENNKLRVLLNGYSVPLVTPFLEFKNSSVMNAQLPQRIIGILNADNAPEYFVFGTLGQDKSSDQPFMGATGFVYYEPSSVKGMGYWMCYINAKTGKISLPMKPRN